jgi:DNA-binding CsgD family transcriptional regulator
MHEVLHRQTVTSWRQSILREVPPTLTEIQRISRRLASAEARTDKIRAERDAGIVAAHAGGESPKLIAVAAGISEMTVFKILRQARARRSDG